jgi:hypothetical protein
MGFNGVKLSFTTAKKSGSKAQNLALPPPKKAVVKQAKKNQANRFKIRSIRIR